MSEGQLERWFVLRQAAWKLLSKIGALLLLGGVAVTIGLFVVTDPPERVPADGEDALGHIAPVAVRLTRDYDVPDPEATERNREAAVADVRPVYDYDPQLLQEVESRVAESFAFARLELASHPAPKRLDPRAKGAPVDSHGDLKNELTGRLQTPIDNRDFLALVEAGFSAQIEEALSTLVRSELSQLVVEDRALLPAERERGILVRPLPDGAGAVVTDLDALRDLTAARSEVERLSEGLAGLPNPGVRRALGHLAHGALRANLVYDAGETARRRTHAREEVAPVVLHLTRGEQIIGAGERIEPRHLMILDAIRSQQKPPDTSRVRVAIAALAALLCFLAYRLARISTARRPSRRDLIFLSVNLVVSLGLVQAILGLAALLRQGVVALPGPVGPFAARLSELDFLAALPYAMPIAAGTILVRLFLGVELTGLFAVTTAVLFGLLREGSLPLTLFALAAGLIAGRRARRVTRKRNLLRVGIFLALTNVGVILFSALLAGRLFETQTAVELGAGIVGGLVLTPLFVGGLAQSFEAIFGYVSDIRLAELCNLNHPALKDLIVRAPGTYHHSIVLAGLAEGAAEAIGANPLLARAVGLYHDVGKGKAPLMFSENQKARADLPSSESFLEILRRHVTDGVEIGRRYRLPRPLLEAIEQHHGTRRVGAASDGLVYPDAERYPGPLPARRETALVMLADAVEAQTRRLASKDVAGLSDSVSSIVAAIAAEGQLDRSGLQIGDLSIISAAFVQSIARDIAARGQEPSPPFEKSARSRTLDLN